MMVKLFSAPSVVPCDLLKTLLDGEEIQCFIQNRDGTSLLGCGWPVKGGSALPWAWPEVWVKQEDYERAKPFADQIQKSINEDRIEMDLQSSDDLDKAGDEADLSEQAGRE